MKSESQQYICSVFVAAAVAVVADVVVVACYTNSSLDHVRDTK